jgi:hypothetical protein
MQFTKTRHLHVACIVFTDFTNVFLRKKNDASFAGRVLSQVYPQRAAEPSSPAGLDFYVRQFKLWIVEMADQAALGPKMAKVCAVGIFDIRYRTARFKQSPLRSGSSQYTDLSNRSDFVEHLRDYFFSSPGIDGAHNNAIAGQGWSKRVLSAAPLSH